MTRVIGQVRGDRLWQRCRHYAYAPLSEAEYAVIKELARRDGQTIADFVRSCLNDRLADEGADVVLVELKEHSGRRPRTGYPREGTKARP
jgi:hypothetical protein